MKKINLLLVLLLSFLLVFPSNVLAEVVGTISYIEGRVDRLSKDGDAYFPLVVGEEISPGDVIRTKSYSKAEITFKDDSIVRLGDSSQIMVKDYSIDENGYRESAAIDLDRGNVRAIVSETKEKAPFDINTPNASGSVKGSDIFVMYQQSATNVMVADGVFSMVNPSFPDHKVDVGKDMAAFVPYNAPPEEPKDFLPALKERLENITGPSVRWAEGVSKKAEFTRAVITEVGGAVRVQPKGSKAWHAPVKNEVLNTGDRIETGKTGRAQINFDNGLVMELKPETQLIILKLTRDPETQDFENVFESGYGKLIAKLKSVPKKSTFVVKTPHAVCGVRGTIMYLNILPNLTSAFFEGGSGFMKDTTSGVTQIVKEGKTGNVDGAGNFTQSDTTDGDRSGFGSQFGNEGQGEYGYTTPGGDDVTYDLPVDPGTPGPPPLLPGEGLTPFDEVKPGVLIQKAQELGLTTVLGELKGKYGDYGSFEKDLDSEIQCAFLGLTSPAPWNGKHPAIIAGTYENPNEYDLFFGEFQGIGDDGGRLLGYGVGSNKPGNTEWESVLAALFIDSSNVGGIMFSGGIREDGQWGGLGGGYDRLAEGNMSGSGDTFYIPVSQLQIPFQIPPIPFAQLVNKNSFKRYFEFSMLDNDGYFDTESVINYLRIPNEYLMDPDAPRFGVWEGIFSADYYNAGDDSWIGFYGGYLDNDGYVFATLEGGDDLNGFLHMDMTASSLDYYTHGTYFGSVVGTYTTTAPIPNGIEVVDFIDHNPSHFEGVGAGGWIYERLNFMSEIEGFFFSFHIDLEDFCDGFYGWEDILLSIFNPGGFTALMGGVGSLCSGGAASTIIGEYWGFGDERDPRSNNIWFAPLYPYNGLDGSCTTYDGGSYYGFLVGFSRTDGSADFLMRGLCVDEFRTGGAIGGAYQGYVFPGAGEEGDGMFWVEGQLNTNMLLPGTGIAPGEFVDICQNGGWEGPVQWDTIMCLGLDTDINFSEGFDITQFDSFSDFLDFLSEEDLNLLIGGMLGQGLFFDIEDIENSDDWGIWASAFKGAFAGNAFGGGAPLPSWELPFTGVVVEGSLFDLIDYIRAWDFDPEDWDFDLEDIDMIQAYMTGQVQGTEWTPNGRIAGNVTGFAISPEKDSNQTAGFNLVRITGEVIGDNEYVEADECIDGAGEDFVAGTWEAAGAGEWVEVYELIDLAGLANQVDRMFGFVDISKIHELSVAASSDFITGAQLNMQLYANDDSLLSGVWAAMVNGTYDPTKEVSQDWFIEFTGESGSVDFHGVEWADNQWLARVTTPEEGALDGKYLAGTAAGTYAKDGTFSGAGAGVWVNEELAKRP